MTVTYGQKCSALLKISGPLGSLAKMLLGTSAWASTTCFLTWKAQATPAKRLLFRLSPSMPNIDGTEFGLWATPQAHDAHPGNPERVGRFGTKHGGRNLNDEAALWPTPQARDGKHGGQAKRYLNPERSNDLPDAVALWPTPTSRDHKSGKASEATHAKNSRPLNEMAAKGGPNGSLNPNFVEYLMGFPKNWTEID